MRKKLLFILCAILVISTTYVYSALSTSLAITSEVKIRPIADIRINDIAIYSSNNATMQYESDYSKNTISSGFILPTAESSISYKVHIDNTGDTDYSIYDILNTSSNNSGLTVTVSGYNLKDIIQAKTSLDLIVTYTTSQPGSEVINVVNTFDFKRVFYITYNTGTNQSIGGQTKYEDIDLVLTSTEPTKTGYTFSKWNTKQDGTGVNYNSGATYTLNEDKILYAQYDINTYTIEYYQGNNSDTAGYTMFNTTSTHAYNTPSNLVTYNDLGGTAPSGWTFAGWSTTVDGTSIGYSDGESVNNLSMTNNDVIKLYAVFKRSVVFKSGVSAATTDAIVEQRYNPYRTDNLTSVTAPSTLVSISNWTAEGYRNDSTADGSLVVKGNAFTPVYDSVDLIYYGVYSRGFSIFSGVERATGYISSNYTQYYNCKNNNVSSVSIPAPASISNWTALGYRDDTTAGAKEYGSGSSASISPAYTSGNTLYAVYSRTLTITYAGNGSTSGSISNTTKTIYMNTDSITTSSQEVTLAANAFERTGYTFSKWTIDTTDYDESSSYTANIAYSATSYTKTANAKWTAIPYSITYNYNNGTVANANPTSYTIESSNITLNNPTKTLTFVGNVNSTSGANAASGQVTIGANTTKAQTFAGWVGSNDLSSGLEANTMSNPYTAGSRDHILGNDFNVVSGTTYRVFVTAKRIAGSLNLQGGLWYTAQTEGNAYDGYSGTFTMYTDLGNGWARYYKDITVPTGKTKAKYYIQLDQSSSTGFTTTWSLAEMHAIEKNAAVTIPTGSMGNKAYTASWMANKTQLPTVTRSGYSCGWNTSSTGTTIQYFSGAIFDAITEDMPATVNLYAVCIKDPEISYNFNSNDMNTWQKQYGERFTITHDSSTGLSKVDLAGAGGWEILYIPITTVSGKTYTFKFDYKDPNGYTALSGYDGIGAQALTAVANSANADNQLAMVSLPTVANSTVTTKTLTFTATGTTTYIAYNFGMAADGVTTTVYLGNFRLVETLKYGNTLGSSVPTVPKPGYTFNGWYTAASGGTQVTSSTSVPASNTTYYAHWTVNSYTVTCEDWFVDASNNRKTKIGTAGTASYNYNTTVSGSAWGSDGTLSKYYTHYAYKGSSSAVVTTSGATVYRYFWAWSNINVLNPAGTEKTDGSVAKFSVSYNGASYIEKVSNEDGNKIILPWGATIRIKDIAMQQSYYLLDSVVWGSTTLTASNGVYTATVSTASTNLNIKTKYQSYYVDLNGYLDNANNGGLSSFGTADVYINGTQVANDVTDYYTQWPYGSTYEFKDIKATTGHKYNGVREGSLSGTVTGNVNTRLNFSTKTVVVTFKPNGGSGSDKTQTFTYGVANQSFSAKGYTRSGWTQGNWAESASGSGVYSILSGVSDGWIDSKSPSITLYATWRDTTNPSVSSWANVSFSGASISNASTASTTITGVGSDGQSGLAKLQYYTTCNSGTTTGSSSSPSEANISSGNATVTINKCNRPVLHYRTKDNAGNVSGWVTGGAFAERLMYAQYYNWLMYYGGTASNNDSNLGSFVNSSNTVHANIGAMIDNGGTTTAINSLSNNDFVWRAYRSILGRVPSQSEINSQVSSLNNGTTRKGLLHAFEDSSESTSIKSGWGY